MGSYGSFNVDAANVVGGRFWILDNGNVGIGNTNPLSLLHLGNCEDGNSMPVIIFGKK